MNLQSNLQKGRGLAGPQPLERAALKDGVNLFREVGGIFHMKNKINLRYLITKRVKAKTVFSVITKN